MTAFASSDDFQAKGKGRILGVHGFTTTPISKGLVRRNQHVHGNHVFFGIRRIRNNVVGSLEEKVRRKGLIKAWR
jgi:hypothetical protein